MSDKTKTHPWAAFLEARADVIDWLKEDDTSDEDIAKQLSMDSTQVRLIRTRERPKNEH